MTSNLVSTLQIHKNDISDMNSFELLLETFNITKLREVNNYVIIEGFKADLNDFYTYWNSIGE